MLDTTMATEFVPGTNVRGEVAGANWSFVLPTLELEQIVCLGVPSQAALTTILRMAKKVIIVDTVEMAALSSDTPGQWARAPHITWMHWSEIGSIADASANLIVIAQSRSLRALARDAGVIRDVQRIVEPAGLVYFEQAGTVDRFRDSAAIDKICAAFAVVKRFWLTPYGGEMHTAVPAQDRNTIEYFIHHGLTSRSLDLGAIKHMARRIVSHYARRATTSMSPAQYGPSTRHPAPAQSRRRLKVAVKRASRAVLFSLFQGTQGALDRAERGLNSRPMVGELARRYGILVGSPESGLGDGPPRYLCEIARQAGVDIGGFRWGLSARGQYSSRKVLFFLFGQEATTPTYIVKMTRDAALNPRLENETRGLRLLAEQHIGDQEILPRVVFSGYHQGLSIVGETVVDGVPFEECSSGTTECRYARAAIDWLIELSTATVNRTRASSALAADVLGSLIDRFTQIYRLTPDHAAFLRMQQAKIAEHETAFPLVFQHGDPGTWNIMVTPTGRSAFLDWEAAEPYGMPLWDLFYFVRTFGAWAMRGNGAGDVMKGFGQQFLTESPFHGLLIDATRRYCAEVGVPSSLIEPLFYTCWMHRALKEATRLAEQQLERGHYLNILRASIDRRAALAALFSAGEQVAGQ